MNIYELEKYEKIVRRLHRDNGIDIRLVNNGLSNSNFVVRYYAHEKFICDRVLFYMKVGISLADLEDKLNKKIIENKRKQEEEIKIKEENKKNSDLSRKLSEVGGVGGDTRGDTKGVYNDVELTKESFIDWIKNFYK